MSDFYEFNVQHIPTDRYDYLVEQNEIIVAHDMTLKDLDEDAEWKPMVREQKVYHNSEFRTVVAVADSFALGLVPLVLLMYFNISIFIMVQKEKNIISKTTDVPLNPKDGMKTDSEDIKMALVLMAIVGVFIFCYLFWLLHAILYAIWCIECNLHQEKENDFCNIQNEGYYLFFDYGGRVLITLNSSVNVFLYGIIQRKFRKEVKEVFANSWKSLTTNRTTFYTTTD